MARDPREEELDASDQEPSQASAWDDAQVRLHWPEDAQGRAQQSPDPSAEKGIAPASLDEGPSSTPGTASSVEQPAASDTGSVASDDLASDRWTLLGLAVTAFALAGIAALLGAHALIGALRLIAGLLAGVGLGLVVLAVLPIGRFSRRVRTLLAAVAALVLALALTVPALLHSTHPRLEDAAAARIPALSSKDRITSAPVPGSPVLIRHGNGSVDVLDTGGSRTIELTPPEIPALSADGTRLLLIGAESTRIQPLHGDAAEERTVPGQVTSLDGTLAVARHCADGACHLSGYDLTTAKAQALWTLSDAPETRGPDPAGVEVPVTAPPAGVLEAITATALMPSTALRYDPAQGWLQIDPRTGFPLGSVLAPADSSCRIAATAPAVGAETGRGLLPAGPTVLTVCPGREGTLQATAWEEGRQRWASAPSPAGTWRVRMQAGRVIGVGIEAGASAEGEIIASQAQAEWSAPGGALMAQAEPLRARIGMDSSRILGVNALGQVVAYDAATGENLWSRPGREGAVRGALGAGSAVLVQPLERRHAMDPRGATVVTVLDAAQGSERVRVSTGNDVQSVHPVGRDRALVNTPDGAWLLTAPR